MRSSRLSEYRTNGYVIARQVVAPGRHPDLNHYLPLPTQLEPPQ